MNTNVFSGGVTADPKVISDKATSVSLAITRPKRDDEDKATVDYLELLYLGEKPAKFAANTLKKGSQIEVEGRLQNDTYTDKDGHSRTKTQLVVATTRFADVKGSSVNRVTLTGGLTNDSKRVSDKLASVHSLAVNRPVASGETDYFDILFLGDKKAQFAEDYLKKGTRILVTGTLQVNSYTDKDGNKRSRVEIVADNTEFIGSRVGTATAATAAVSVTEEDDDDIPFA